MANRGRHQSTSKECRDLIRRIEALDGVVAVIIGHSYGGKSLASKASTGSIRVQRQMPAGLKAVMQSSRGLQELFIRIEGIPIEAVARQIEDL